VFVTGTCRQAQDHVTSGRARDAISLAHALASGAIVPRVINASERQAVELCDLLVTHSELTRQMMSRFFPAAAGKMYPNVVSFAEWICEGARAWRHQARPFAERDIDVLFVANDWSRPEKNYSLVRAISKKLDGARIHIVGDVPDTLPSATHHGFITSQNVLFDLFGRARSVACPSSFDAAPGILYQGSVMECNLVASMNCGNWELCHPELLADPFAPETFTECIGRALQRKYDDHLEAAPQGGYRELMALLTAFAQPFEAQTLP
jgi:hypothetical protein